VTDANSQEGFKECGNLSEKSGRSCDDGQRKKNEMFKQTDGKISWAKKKKKKGGTPKEAVRQITKFDGWWGKGVRGGLEEKCETRCCNQPKEKGQCNRGFQNVLGGSTIDIVGGAGAPIRRTV